MRLGVPSKSHFSLFSEVKKKLITAMTDWFEFLEYCVILSVGDDANKYLYLVLKALIR